MAASTMSFPRLRGVFIFICGLGLLAFGTWLLYLTLGKPMPDWLPDAIRPGADVRISGLDETSSTTDRLRSLPGLASLFLLSFGAIAATQGALMGLLGRRSFVLLVLMMAFAAVMIGAGFWVSLKG